MASVRSKDTKPELRLRRALHALGYRYRVNFKGAPGKPDLAFTRRKVAVFVDGDYWHGNAWKHRGFVSLEDQFSSCNNGDFWLGKIRRNMERDTEVNEQLRSLGWVVVRLWESDLEGSFDACLATVRSKLETAS